MNFLHPLPAAEFIGSKDRTLVRLCQGKTVLHLGFVNEGNLHDQLRQHIWLHGDIAAVASRVVGVDISEQGVQEARELGYSDCYVGDVEKLSAVPFPRINYDLILAPDIIEHLANPGLFLTELHKVVPEETSVIITTPNALSIRTIFFPIVGTEATHPDHNFIYSPTTLITLLKKYGFNVTGVGLYSHVWVPSRKNLRKPLNLIGKSLFTVLDFALRYSVVPVFPYFSEGILVRIQKEGRGENHTAHSLNERLVKA